MCLRLPIIVQTFILLVLATTSLRADNPTTAPAGSQDIDTLRNNGISAIEALHDTAKHAQADRATFAQAAADSDKANAQLRQKLADLSATTKAAPVLPEVTPAAIVHVGQSIQAAVDAAKPGDFIRIDAGIYNQSVKINKPITLFAERIGAVVLDGQWKLKTGLDIAGGRAIGLRVIHFASDFENSKAAVLVRKGATIDYLDVDENAGSGIGLPAGSHGASVLHCRARDNGYSGICGTQSDDVKLIDCEIRGNNAGNELNIPRAKANPSQFFVVDGKGVVSPGFELNKFTRTNRLLVDGMTALDNRGAGFWLDIDNRDFTIRNSTFGGGRKLLKSQGAARDYNAPGLYLEINFGPGKIENCRFVKGDGPALGIAECVGVSVTGCQFQDTYFELRAMQLAGMTTRVVRGQEGTNKPIQIKDITIAGNTFANSKIETSIGTWTPASAKDRNIVLDHNIFQNAPGATWVRWNNQSYTTEDALRSILGWQTP
jgi:hypothetical protein